MRQRVKPIFSTPTGIGEKIGIDPLIPLPHLPPGNFVHFNKNRQNFRIYWVVNVADLVDNPYDGHPLDRSILGAERITKVSGTEANVDRGYRKHDYKGSAVIRIAGLSRAERRRKCRRSSVKKWGAEIVREQLDVPNCRSLIRLDKEIHPKGKTPSVETRYYMSSLDPEKVSAKEFQASF